MKHKNSTVLAAKKPSAYRLIKNTRHAGFTLIEVVLVLAIGGLTFLLAFLAFQQVSVNRRDTQRRADAGRIVAELQNYFTDKGIFPDDSINVNVAADICTPGGGNATSFRRFLSEYMCVDGEFKPPNSTRYRTYTVDTTPIPAIGIKYYKNRTCASESVEALGSVRVEIGLEKGDTVCRDNS